MRRNCQFEAVQYKVEPIVHSSRTFLCVIGEMRLELPMWKGHNDLSLQMLFKLPHCVLIFKSIA